MRLVSAGVSRQDRAHPILVMQVQLPGIDYGCMDTASARPASVSIDGDPGATLLSAFPELVPERQGARNRSRRLLDQSVLCGVLAEIETLGPDLIGARRLTPRESPQPMTTGHCGAT